MLRFWNALTLGRAPHTALRRPYTHDFDARCRANDGVPEHRWRDPYGADGAVRATPPSRLHRPDSVIRVSAAARSRLLTPAT